MLIHDDSSEYVTAVLYKLIVRFANIIVKRILVILKNQLPLPVRDIIQYHLFDPIPVPFITVVYREDWKKNIADHIENAEAVILFMSKRILANSYTSVTWETCALRKWLNGTFINAAFSSEEQDHIINSTVTADKNPSYSTSPGNNTTDKVFLLSVTEVTEYFLSDVPRKCVPTDYVIAQGAWTDENYHVRGRATCWWWLRSPGDDPHRAALIDGLGYVNYSGDVVHNSLYTVRPALWINLES